MIQIAFPISRISPSYSRNSKILSVSLSFTSHSLSYVLSIYFLPHYSLLFSAHQLSFSPTPINLCFFLPPHIILFLPSTASLSLFAPPSLFYSGCSPAPCQLCHSVVLLLLPWPFWQLSWPLACPTSLFVPAVAVVHLSPCQLCHLSL